MSKKEDLFGKVEESKKIRTKKIRRVKKKKQRKPKKIWSEEEDNKLLSLIN